MTLCAAFYSSASLRLSCALSAQLTRSGERCRLQGSIRHQLTYVIDSNTTGNSLRDSALSRMERARMVQLLAPTWYVTFEIRKRGLLSKKERSPRETRTFATEAEAKMFARVKLDNGLVVFAGTINPHLPKRLILSNSIANWLEEPSESATNEDQ
jgi:hypothetical protein